MNAQPTLDAELFPVVEHEHRTMGRCPAHGCGYVRTKLEHDIAPAPVCPTHLRPLRWQRIEGKHSAGRRCDDRCIFARGPNCECSCAGANHGRGW